MDEDIFYFKTREEIPRYGESSNRILDDDPQCIPITEEEYNAAIEKLIKSAESEEIAYEKSKDDRIAELEAENAALLYQVLTGEELTDV